MVDASEESQQLDEQMEMLYGALLRLDERHAPLDAPRATALSSASMLLEWSAPAATAACKLDLKWRVEMRRGQSSGKAGGWEQVATVAAPRAIVREGLRCGLGCSFRVTVLGIDGWNAPSEASPALTGDVV